MRSTKQLELTKESNEDENSLKLSQAMNYQI